jgi:hypothetical protein
MNFFGDSTDDLFDYLTGEKLLSPEENQNYLNDLIQKTSDQDEINTLMKRINYNLNLKHTEWKSIYKTLKLIETLIKSASEKFLYNIKYSKELLYILTKFNYEVNGAENIREKAKLIYNLLESDEQINKERNKYNLEKEREEKEELSREGGFLSSLGSYNFNKKKISKKQLDLMRKKDDSSSSDEDNEKNNKKNIQKKQENNKNENNNNIINNDDNIEKNKNEDIFNLINFNQNNNNNNNNNNNDNNNNNNYNPFNDLINFETNEQNNQNNIDNNININNNNNINDNNIQQSNNIDLLDLS